MVFLDIESTTPEGSPAPDFIPLNQQQAQSQPAAPAQDTSAILAALANMAKTNQTASTATPGIPAIINPNSVLNQNAVPQVPPSVDKAGMQTTPQAVNPFAGNLVSFGMSNGAMNPNGQSQMPNQNLFPNLGQQQNPLAALMGQMGQTNTPAAPVPDPQLQQVQVLQYLIAQGVPQDQWAPVLQAIAASTGNQNGSASGLGGIIGSGLNWPQSNAAQNSWGGKNDAGSRDEGRRDYGRSPPHQYNRRRSRSPDYRRRESPPGRRGSPVYGDYSGESPGRSRDPRDARGRGGREYRQRSPAGRRRRSPSPARKDDALPPPGPKFIEYDYSIGQGNIKGKFGIEVHPICPFRIACIHINL
jgi:protein NRD1